MTEQASVAEKQAPPQQENPEVAEMYCAGLHFGYSKTRRHPGMRPFIFGTKSNVEVFDLYKVQTKLHELLEAMRALGREEKILLFVGTKAAAREATRAAARDLGMPHVTERWLGGTLTNFKVITDRVNYWQDLVRQKEAGELKKYTKHEQTKLSQHMQKLEYMFAGLETVKRVPHALMVIDLKEEALAVREARRRDIPVFALSNTDTDPSLAAQIVPGNDNAKASISYVLQKVVAAYKEGAAQRAAAPLAEEEQPNA